MTAPKAPETTQISLQYLMDELDLSRPDKNDENLMDFINSCSRNDVEYIKTLSRARATSKERNVNWSDVKKVIGPMQSLSNIPKNSKALQTSKKWANIGGYFQVKKVLEQTAIYFYKYPEKFQKLCISPAKGALLYGPPGWYDYLIYLY